MPEASMIQPFRLGKRLFPSNLIQAPLAGISFSPFRQLLWQYGGLAYACTEMISAKTLLYQQQHRAFRRFTHRHPNEKVLCYQLSGNNATELADAARLSESFGADIIDLNCGCPQPKIVKKQAGAYHLCDLGRLAELINAMRAATRCPLTVKVRLYPRDQSHKNILLAQMIAESGADALIVHGRRQNERYDTSCDLEAIAHVCAAVDIPVIINGDVTDYNALMHAMRITGAQAAMIGRASMGQPWLYKSIAHQAKTGQVWRPSLEVIKRTMLTHLDGLATFKGQEQAVLLFRRLLPYYLSGQSGAHRFIDFANKNTDFSVLYHSLSVFDLGEYVL